MIAALRSGYISLGIRLGQSGERTDQIWDLRPVWIGFMLRLNCFDLFFASFVYKQKEFLAKACVSFQFFFQKHAGMVLAQSPC